MHELSITRSLLEIALREGEAHSAKRIIKITLDVGKLSGALAHAIRFCFDAVAQGTLAENAVLEIHESFALALCQDCGHEFTIERFVVDCPTCHGARISVTGGDALLVRSIEIETAQYQTAEAIHSCV